MAEEITLLDLLNGDVDYVAKGVANNAVLRDTINSLLALVTGGQLGFLTFAYFLAAVFNDDPGLIGYGSYACSSGGASLTVQSGTAWKPSSQALVQFAGPATI